MKSFKVKCLHVCIRHIFVIHMISKKIHLLVKITSQWKKVDNFQRNYQGGYLDLQNEVNFSPRETYLAIKISCKCSEASWCSFPLRVLASKISMHGSGGGIA